MTEAEFESFFRRYYRERILELARGYPEESRSLTIRWDDLYQYDPDLADALRAHPERTLAEARDALASFDVPVDVDLEGAAVHVSGYPRTTPIRELRSAHANRLVAVRGIVRKATPVRPKVEVAVYECLTCGGRTELVQRGHELREPNRCPHCERNSPFDRLDDQSRFVDAQRLRIQESPEGLRGGETPQNIDVHLEEDLTGVVSPGDRVTAVGVLKLREQESGGRTSPILDVYLEGNHLELEEEEFEVMEVDDADVEAIEALAASDDIYERVVDSIAPSIWGYEEEKLAMALQLFSGVRKNLPDGSRVRGDIHVLLVGDPGTGKSQLLQYISKIAPRSVYTSGKGSSAAGLCVTGDTMIHTTEGFRRIEDIVAEDLPDAVQTDTPAEAGHEVYTYDRVAGSIRPRETSRVWRMPEKPCRRIETAAGKTLEASVNTPVLTLGEDGLAWRRVADIDAGDPVAVPKYFGVDRRTPGVHEYLEFTTEKLKLTDDAVSFIRHRLVDTYGSLRDAAAALGLTEDDLYSTLPNRHVPLEKLDRILDAIGLDRDDVAIDRAMVRHGSSVRIPAAFDADLMYLIGLVFGDGEVRVSPRGGNRGYVRLSNGDESILERAAAIIEDKFDVGVDIERQPARVPSIRLHSVTVARWFRNLGIESPKVDIALDHRLTTAEHTDAFLRGLFDADGAVCERDDGGSSVQLSTISPKFGRQLQLMLETYGVRARLRERDPSPPATRDDGLVIEGNYSRHELLIYGADIDRFADRIEFDARAKRAALDRIAGAVERRGETLPIGETLAKADGGTAGGFHNTLVRGNDPTLETARRLLREADLGDLESAVREVVTDGIAWDEVVAAEDIGDREVFDLTVPTSHNFAGNGLITHNTAAAVRDDFGDGSQWSLEAGALVLADQGIAAVDELDKMRSEDRSAMHEALEQQSYHPDFEVELADRTCRSIGELVESRFESAPEQAIEGVDCEILPVGDVEILTASPSDDTVRSVEIDRVSRHEAPDSFIELEYSNGTNALVTPEHPVFVADSTEWKTIPACELDGGEFVPGRPTDAVPDGGAVTFDQRGTISPAAHRIEAVSIVENAGQFATEYVYDITVEPTHTFLTGDIVFHNSVSVSKAGINATLQARCALLGAANPTYGRFDQYEPIAEQIDLEPALVSRFDLIFTVDDLPDQERDERIAEHILRTNYAGELSSRQAIEVDGGAVAELEDISEHVTPPIDPGRLRAYVAYATQRCIPTMTEEARQAIKDFYLDLRAEGVDEDSPIPMTARKLEALVRLAEASARIRLADEVTREDAERVIELVRASMGDIGFDPETGTYDVDMIETGTPKTQRDRIRTLKGLIETLEDDFEDGIPLETLIEEAEERGLAADRVEHELEKMKQTGEIYEPSGGRFRLA